MKSLIVTTPIIKCCGITLAEDICMLADLGVQWVGFIFHPASPRNVTPEQVAKICTPASMKRVGVFVNQDAQEIISIMKTAKLDFAQLHGGQSVECAQSIGAKRVMRVLWPSEYANTFDIISAAHRHKNDCFMFLLDSGVRGGGGTGQTIPLSTFTTLKLPRPYLLAGGLSCSTLSPLLDEFSALSPHNRPIGFDLNSGVESSPGIKSPQLLQQTIELINSYD